MEHAGHQYARSQRMPASRPRAEAMLRETQLAVFGLFRV